MRQIIFQVVTKAMIIVGYLSLLMLATSTLDSKQNQDTKIFDNSDPLN